MISDREAIKELELQLFKIQRQLYDSPLRDGSCRKTMSFNATTAFSDKVAVLASAKGITRSQFLREIVAAHILAIEAEQALTKKPKKDFLSREEVAKDIDF